LLCKEIFLSGKRPMLQHLNQFRASSFIDEGIYEEWNQTEILEWESAEFFQRTARHPPAGSWVLAEKKRKENKTMLISHQRFSSGSPRRRQSSIKRRKRSSRHWGTWGTSFSSSLVLRILASLPYHVTCNACPCVLWKSLSVESFVAASRVQTMKMWKCTLSLAMRQKTPGPGPRKPITKYPDLARKTQPKSNPLRGAGA